MKKLILSFSLFLFLACALNAQIGIRAGLNLANQSASDVEEEFDTKSLMGFHFGITYDKVLNESLTFRPGLLFSMKGAEIDGFDAKIKFNYLEIPLDFAFGAGPLDINAGPYIGYALSGKTEFLGTSEDIEFGEGGAKRLDFGLNLGLSYGINEMLAIGAQYGLGLSNISDNAEGEEGSLKNNVIGIYVRYSL